MFRIIYIFLLPIASCVQLYAQQSAMSFQSAESQGISIEELDKTYMSAVHVDPTLAVFKSEEEQMKLQQAYYALLQDLGNFLAENDFQWEQPTRCFNRIYFNEDGTIDYFLFNFVGKAESAPSAAVQDNFEALLNRFVQDYTFPLTADRKFAQCSPATFSSQ